MGLKVLNGKVVAVHQLTNRWAVHRDPEGELFAVPVHARAFVLEKHETGEPDYLEAYDLCIESDGCLYDASENENWVECVDAGTEQYAVALSTRNKRDEEKEEAKRVKQ